MFLSISKTEKIILISEICLKAQIIMQDLTAGNWINQALDPCILVIKVQSPFQLSPWHKSLKKMTVFHIESIMKPNKKSNDSKG